MYKLMLFTVVSRVNRVRIVIDLAPVDCRYGFRDRQICGALTTEGKVITSYVQSLGMMRWGLCCSVNHFKVRCCVVWV